MGKFKGGIGCSIVVAGLVLMTIVAMPSGAATSGGRPGIGSTLGRVEACLCMDLGQVTNATPPTSALGLDSVTPRMGETYEFTQLDVVAGIVAAITKTCRIVRLWRRPRRKYPSDCPPMPTRLSRR